MTAPNLHFYANENNDVLIRTAWFKSVEALFQQGIPDSSIHAAVDALLKTAPGPYGKYSVWNNVKCPYCRKEFPYRFKENLKLRLRDNEVILINGCKIDNDEGLFEVEVELRE